MAVPERIRGAYIEYLDSMAEAKKSRRPVDGLLGFSWSESDRIQERFANELRSAVEDFAAGQPGSGEAAEALRFIYAQAHDFPDRDSGVYWMLLASHAFSLPLVELLNAQDARAMRELYEAEFPRRERFPAQKNVLTALKTRERA